MEIDNINIKDKISEVNFRGGTICIWGDWFGKPYDNFHKIIEVVYILDKDRIEFIFDQNEKLVIDLPHIILLDNSHLIIKNAQHIRLEWYSYGNEYTIDNLYFLDYVKNQEIQTNTNIDWTAYISKANPKEDALLIINKF